MAFVPLTTAEIASGEPVKNSTLTKIKNDLDDHETRISDIEVGTAVDYPPIILELNGNYSADFVLGQAGELKTTMNFNLRVTGVFLYAKTAGVSGTTEIDIKYKRGVAAYTSILTTRPSVGFASGNDAVSSNAVIDVNNDNLQAGDILRLDVTSAQVGGNGLFVRIDYVRE